MKFYALKEGAMYEAEISLVTNPSKILGAITENFVHYVGEVYDGVHLGIRNSGGNICHVLAMEVPHLRFSTRFGMMADPANPDELIHFIDYYGGIKGVVDWIVPDGYRMFFCYSDDGASFPYHMLFVNPDGKIVNIPMSNCHDAGSVCHGNVPCPRGRNIVQGFRNAVDAYWESDWNDHLIGYESFVDHNKHIFRWDAYMNQLPMNEPNVHLEVINPNFCGSSIIDNIVLVQNKPSYETTTLPKCGGVVREVIADDDLPTGPFDDDLIIEGD